MTTVYIVPEKIDIQVGHRKDQVAEDTHQTMEELVGIDTLQDIHRGIHPVVEVTTDTHTDRLIDVQSTMTDIQTIEVDSDTRLVLVIHHHQVEGGIPITHLLVLESLTTRLPALVNPTILRPALVNPTTLTGKFYNFLRMY